VRRDGVLNGGMLTLLDRETFFARLPFTRLVFFILVGIGGAVRRQLLSLMLLSLDLSLCVATIVGLVTGIRCATLRR